LNLDYFSRRSVLEPGNTSQDRRAQPQAPLNNEPAPGPNVNREAPAATPTTARPDISTSTNEQRLQQRSRRHKLANELPGFQPGPLRPPLRFEGFEIGLGDWQPWESSSHSPSDVAGEGSSSEVIASIERMSAIPASTSTSSGSTPSDPREAAASAALRRVGSRSGTHAVGRPDQQTSPPSSNMVGNTAILPDTISEKGKGVLTSLLSEQRLASQARGRELGIPAMIPLYDPSIRASSTNPRISLHPPPLSSTTVTRDSIDERLRALNEVQNALWKSAEELLKLKSLLPASTAPFDHTLSSSPVDRRDRMPSVKLDQGREAEIESYPSEDD
jgi:hypothetical protein